MMTVYKMHGYAYDFLAAVDEENKDIRVLTDSQDVNIKALRREDVTDCSSWDLFTHDGWAADHDMDVKDPDVWGDMMNNLVYHHGTATMMEKWNEMDI